MGKRTGPSKERQLELAYERGLLPRPDPSQGIQVHRKALPLGYDKKPEPVTVVPVVEKVNPCKDCPGGRHEVPGGHCIDGRFWSHADMHCFKVIDMRHGKGTSKKLLSPGVLKLHDLLDLDWGNAILREHVPEHTVPEPGRP